MYPILQVPYRPQFAYPPPPEGFIDEDFEYVFSAANTPVIAGGLLPGQMILNVSLPLEMGPEYRIRSLEVIDPSGAGGFRFRDALGTLLSETGAFVPSPLAYDVASLVAGLSVDFAKSIAIEPELVCPGGSALTVDIKNLS